MNTSLINIKNCLWSISNVLCADYKLNYSSQLTVDDKTKIIEFILLRLELSYVYIYEENVVKGLDLISVIQEFVDDKFILNPLFLLQFKDCTYSTLPRYAQRAFQDFQLNMVLIQKPTPKEFVDSILTLNKLKL